MSEHDQALWFFVALALMISIISLFRPKGVPGPKGKSGMDGPPGPAGLSGVQQNTVDRGLNTHFGIELRIDAAALHEALNQKQQVSLLMIENSKLKDVIRSIRRTAERGEGIGAGKFVNPTPTPTPGSTPYDSVKK